MKKTYIWVIIVILGIGAYWITNNRNLESDAGTTLCTEEAKICADGSAVGRTGPNCEFAICPNFNGNAIFEPLTTKYITAQNWPPASVSISGEFLCDSGGSQITSEGQTVQRTINGKRYCVTTQSEGAAGSTYTTYKYTTQNINNANQLTQTTFTLRFPQCENYDNPEKTVCKNEREIFNPDSIVEPGISIACYKYHHDANTDAPYTVNELISITTNGNNVTGTKKGSQSGPDMTNGYQGEITGTISNNTLTAVFDYVIEGSSNKEKEIYAVTDFRLTKHRYPLIEENGMLVPDTTKDFTELIYQQGKCD